MSSMFRKPIKKELQDLIPRRQKIRVPLKPTQTVGTPSNTNATSGSKPGVVAPIPSASTPSAKLPETQPVDPDDDNFVPTGKFIDIQIVSLGNTEWKYNVMKLAGAKDKEADLTQWRQPIKLSRKEPPTYKGPIDGVTAPSLSGGSSASNVNTNKEKDAKEPPPVVGPDVKNIKGPDGRVVTVKADAKAGPSAESTNGPASASASTPNSSAERRRRKTKRVYPVSAETLKLRSEERYPWVLEGGPLKVESEINDNGDSKAAVTTPSTTPNQVWVGRVEDPEKNKTHGLLLRLKKMPSVYHFVPLNRFYRFTKQRTHLFAQDELQKEHLKRQKSENLAAVWAKNQNLSAATLATLGCHVKASEDSEDLEFGNVDEPARTDAPNDDLFGEKNEGEDEEGTILRQGKNKNWEDDGYYDEVEYEEEFADDDDDENKNADGDEEQWKFDQIQERQRREYRNANILRDGNIDDDSDGEELSDTTKLTGEGYALKNLVLKNEKNEAYESDSDEEEEPYISEEEEGGEEGEDEPQRTPFLNSEQPSPGLAPTSVVAGEAKPEKPVKSRDLAAVKPTINAAKGPQARAKTALKRKARDSGDEGLPSSSLVLSTPGDDITADARSPKKPKGELTEAMVVAFLKGKKGVPVTVKDCVQEFSGYLRDKEIQKSFTKMVAKVAYNKGKSLVLRKEH